MTMGKLVCSELEGGGPDLSGLLMALVIAITLMIICSIPPPRRALVAVYRHG